MSSTKIISAVIVAVLAVAGISAIAINSNKPVVVDKAMSKTSEVMMKKDDATMMEKMTPEEKAAFEKMTPAQKESMMMEKEKMMKDGVPGDAMMKKEGDSMKKDDAMMKKTGYLDYSLENLAANSTGKNIIFFKASWCPTCKTVDADITTNLSKIPAGVNIMKVDYDNSTELKKKYGVTQQHTFVAVDKDGNKINSNVGAPTLDAVLALVK
jgi:thioredoxin 1